jgi:hypothetical protein
MGASNTGKTTIIDFIINHFGIHAKKITAEGKFTFSDSPNTLLRWSDEINLYSLYKTSDLNTTILAILDRKPTNTPMKHQNQQCVSSGLFLTATNPERDNPYFTAYKNNYDTKVFKPLNNRVERIALEYTFPDGKTDNSATIDTEIAYASYLIAMNSEIPYVEIIHNEHENI